MNALGFLVVFLVFMGAASGLGLLWIALLRRVRRWALARVTMPEAMRAAEGRLRLTAVILAVWPGCVFAGYFLLGVIRGDLLADDANSLFMAVCTLGLGFSIFVMALAWYMLALAFWVISSAGHRLFGGRTTREEWHRAGCEALRVWPCAAGAGALLGLVYSLGDIDLYDSWDWGAAEGVFIILANLIGACCYVPLLWRWYRLRAEVSKKGRGEENAPPPSP